MMEIIKLQDLVFAAESITNSESNSKLIANLLHALKEIALEVKCTECDGRGYLTGVTAFKNHAIGKCPRCAGTGKKYFIINTI